MGDCEARLFESAKKAGMQRRGLHVGWLLAELGAMERPMHLDEELPNLDAALYQVWDNVELATFNETILSLSAFALCVRVWP